MDTARKRFTITGAVQGVGFRPFIYRIALDHSLTGSVKNTPEGVIIEIQGPADAVTAFSTDLHDKLPPLASIVTCDEKILAPVPDENAFEIIASTGGEGHSVLISPDVATCNDCLDDMNDPDNPRYLYPFTNCTNCGPRYTITRSIPYDRDKTSMACFPLCESCAKEYQDPLDRRFHAQPNACPICGPEVWLTTPDGKELARGEEALRQLASELAAGKVAAVKGLGGFHLACDATDENAVTTLRQRKNRYGKPLAVMVPDLDAARQLAELGEAESDWLTGIKRPIVLAQGLTPSPLAPAVAPDTPFVGLMLPYTPLHHVLFNFYGKELGGARLPALVMTSGNLSSEPISLGNREALSRLSNIADVFLLHNRDILIRCDDSVLRVVNDGHAKDAPQFLRRARGFTPSPVFLSRGGPCVLGTGPELKTTLCLTKNDQAFVSQHIGTMENLETFGFYKEIAAHLQGILQVEPQAVICDLHPNYMTTEFARESGLPMHRVQHHVAHVHAVMAENKFDGACIGLALDGTGYGEDGTLWGGEVLLVDNEELCHERLAHFSPVRLPGGEAAIKEPWRIAQSMLWELGQFEPFGRTWGWLDDHAQASAIVTQMLERNVNCPASTSCGRLFDAVSALLNLKPVISYEAEAAIMLESVQDMTENTAYPCALRTASQPALLDTLALFACVAEDWEAGTDPAIISRRFHLGLIQGLADTARAFADVTGISHVGLSGGVMLNKTLAEGLPRALRNLGLSPLTHRELPPGDACISLGQAAYGVRLLEKDDDFQASNTCLSATAK
ncbi:carbamoyltransferase HypF [Desulfovibrio ferrophilus]|uniref:Carbamoyltransferase n=1 Tax=Desulfovibrio ferrophilus TaxID=241368 RepID=A0A2Z6AYV9_9BACT|nr:carbamoyltransferase HypF [Desulfovibrio ferrophilus]BBD08388.1 (NiFe) hydrogenase maturation protein HypF [Desulfovibrio ferrophilus]